MVYQDNFAIWQQKHCKFGFVLNNKDYTTLFCVIDVGNHLELRIAITFFQLYIFFKK